MLPPNTSNYTDDSLARTLSQLSPPIQHWTQSELNKEIHQLSHKLRGCYVMFRSVGSNRKKKARKKQDRKIEKRKHRGKPPETEHKKEIMGGN